MAYFATAAYIVAAVTAAYGTYQQGKTAKKVAAYNAQMNEWAAKDAVRKGETDAQTIRRKAAMLKATQRSTMAARGLDLTEGSAAQIIDETDFFSNQDQATARTNAAKEAWALRTRGAAGLTAAEAQANQANLSAFSTVLGAGGQVADRWYQGSNYSGTNDFSGITGQNSYDTWLRRGRGGD